MSEKINLGNTNNDAIHSRNAIKCSDLQTVYIFCKYRFENETNGFKNIDVTTWMNTKNDEQPFTRIPNTFLTSEHEELQNATETQELVTKAWSDNETFVGINSTEIGPRYSSLFVPVTATSVGLLVMLFNGLVIILSCTNLNLRNNTYLFLVFGLSITDFVLGVSSFLNGIRLFFFAYSSSLDLCILLNVLSVSSLLMSLYQTFCISLHRFLFRGKRKYFLCIFAWVMFVTIIYSLVAPSKESGETCDYSVVFSGSITIFGWVIISFQFALIPLTLIFYCLAIYHMKMRYLNISSRFSKNVNESKRKKMFKSMRLISFLLLALFLLTVPLTLVLVIDIITKVRNISSKIVVFFYLLAYVNSIINPIIYLFNVTEFQSAFKSLFCNINSPDNKKDEKGSNTNELNRSESAKQKF